MLNIFKIKEMFAFIVPQFVTVTAFMIIMPIYGFLIASASAVVFIIIGTIIGKLIIKNEFMDMLKGEGLLTIPLDSKGLATPFLCKFRNGMLEGETKLGQKVKASFDRKVIFNMSSPKEIDGYKSEEGDIFIKINEDQFNKGRMSMYHLPLLFWNEQMNSFVTKDWLSERETETFSRHHIIHANKLADNLSESMTNFGRYIAENSTKKISSFFSNPIVKTILIIGVAILLIVLIIKLAPSLTGSIKEGMLDVVPKAGNTIQPIP